MIMIRQEDGGRRRVYTITDTIISTDNAIDVERGNTRHHFKVPRGEFAFRFQPRMSDGTVSRLSRPGICGVGFTVQRACELIERLLERDSHTQGTKNGHYK